MTLLQAISTGRLYSRTGGVWMKSENVHWPIRYTQNSAPVPLSEADILADDWLVDIRPKGSEYGWIINFEDVDKSGNEK